jgi:hypothetical protein
MPILAVQKAMQGSATAMYMICYRTKPPNQALTPFAKSLIVMSLEAHSKQETLNVSATS